MARQWISSTGAQILEDGEKEWITSVGFQSTERQPVTVATQGVVQGRQWISPIGQILEEGTKEYIATGAQIMEQQPVDFPEDHQWIDPATGVQFLDFGTSEFIVPAAGGQFQELGFFTDPVTFVLDFSPSYPNGFFIVFVPVSYGETDGNNS